MTAIEGRLNIPSYEELLRKIKVLEQERDSLLTALGLLREDACASSNQCIREQHQTRD